MDVWNNARLIARVAGCWVLTAAVAAGGARAAEPPADAAAATGSDGAALVLPDDARGRCVRAFLDTISDPTPEAVAAFEQAHASGERRAGRSPEARVQTARSLNARSGRVSVGRVLVVGESVIVITAAPERGEELSMEFQFSLKEPGRFDGVLIMPASQADEPEPVTAAARKTLVERAAAALLRQYVFPDKGREMAELIRARLEAGAYDALTDEASLTRRLTHDLQSVSADKHLRLRAQAQREEAESEESRERALLAFGDNHGFRRVEILPGNIGYVRFDGFAEGEDAERTAAAAIMFVANCSALVFDMRFNGGGSPQMVRFVTSYLFEKRTHLNDMVDRDGGTVEEYWTLEEVPGRRPAPSTPVYVLTSAGTFSGAEEFTYNLKSLKRAVVVGETTGGGAHPVRPVRLGNRFVMTVPFMRARNPVTKTNWEGTGVQPDIACPADEALDRAIQAIRGGTAERLSR